ncbi:MAG TPA: hypothetical protein VME24_06100 [Alphaproteobacteria bacterium]|nr:hypothetical protein [Alphaproteobacteria bacterium]
MRKTTVIMAIAAFVIISARGQGFLNLDFESAQNLPGNPGNDESVSEANALPDWTVYAGPAIPDNALSDIYYVSNYISGSQSPVELEGGTLALSGNYSVELFGDSAIGQTGLVPDNAESLEFEAYGLGGGEPGPSGFSVTLGGQTLSYTVVSEGAGYTVYGANIPSQKTLMRYFLLYLI